MRVLGLESGRHSGGQAEMGEDLGDHGGMFDACPEPVEGDAMIFKMPLHWPETPKPPKLGASGR
jgi:hypothetical protein